MKLQQRPEEKQDLTDSGQGRWFESNLVAMAD